MRKFVDRILPVVSIAALVGALVVGAASLKSLTGPAEQPASPPVAAGPSADPTVVDLDLGPTSEADVTSCLTPGFAADAAEVDVLYGVEQRRLGGSSPVLVLRNAAGDVRLCDQFGGDSPSQAPLATASPAHPVAFLSNGRSSWSCAGTTKVLNRFEQSTWLAVAPEVSTVQQRYLVGGVPGAWFTSRAQDGYVHLQSWLEGPEPASTRFAEQFRVLDASGDDVPQTALPTRQSLLPGCSKGGSAQIG